MGVTRRASASVFKPSRVVLVIAIYMSLLKPGSSNITLVDTCDTCGEEYESFAENAPCPNCSSPLRKLPSGRLYNIALVSVAVASVVGVWLLLAWPRSFEMMAYPQPSLEENLSIGGLPDLVPNSQTQEQATLSPTASLRQDTTSEPSANGEQSSPTSQQAPSSTPTPAQKRYIVQPGNTLSRIAELFGVTTESVISANGLANSELIQPGDELTIPQ